MMPSGLTSPTPKPGPGCDNARNREMNHPTYFWEFIRFKAEGVCFQLPKARFVTDSDTFAAEYGIPPSSDKGGLVEENIFELDVGLAEYESFLKAFLPGCPSHHHSQLDLTFEEWLSVLKLSSKWLFKDLRNVAIAKLDTLPMTPIQRVLLARQYSIPSWLIEGYVRILNRMAPTLDRPTFISQEEACDGSVFSQPYLVYLSLFA
ncbi:hypothetical protein BKA70DRAFT_1286210 [Coprinopsis sp. MPI-PUGE-AT-0042]|nr:hypothetical protein BKA70DRAFT_1286210 [Coprinopsis sp. MPI-PUGE-AT-0042]